MSKTPIPLPISKDMEKSIPLFRETLLDIIQNDTEEQSTAHFLIEILNCLEEQYKNIKDRNNVDRKTEIVIFALVSVFHDLLEEVYGEDEGDDDLDDEDFDDEDEESIVEVDFVPKKKK